MKYVVKLPDNKKAIMDIVNTIPLLPEGYEVLGLADDLPEAIMEIESDRQSESLIQAARQLLADTDWKVMRHRDQLDAGVPTSITAEEFAQLLVDRQTARDSI
jgi:hypothetical protein